VAIKLSRDELPRSETARVFEGADYGEIGVSFFLTDTPAGHGTGLHRHPYAEVFIVNEGHARFRVDDETIEAGAGEIVIVPPGVPHAFTNRGTNPLRLVTLHPQARMSTEWLE
jgi:quercetin dioxygenase-like cupin family protein